MIRGAKPKPSAMKRLHGTERTDRAKNEPVPPAGDLVPSEQLNRVKHARGLWDHYLASSPLGLLKPVDAPLLERLCIALAMARQAMDEVIALGLVVKSPDKGVPIHNPFLPIVNRQTEIARKLASELGLPVTARARIDLPERAFGSHDTDIDEDGSRRARRYSDDLDRFLDQHPDRELN